MNPSPSNPVPLWRKFATRRWVLIFILLIGLVFHRPILLNTLRIVAQQVAAHEDVHLTLELEGNLFSHLTIKNIKARGKGNSPIRSVDVAVAEFDYKLTRFFRQGLHGLLTRYHLENAWIEIDIHPGDERKSELAKLIRETLQQPALFTDALRIKEATVIVHAPDGIFTIRGINADLNPTTEGFIRIDEVTLPEIGSWYSLKTEATFEKRKFVSGSFSLGEEIQIQKLVLDGSRQAEGIDYLALDAKLLGSQSYFYLWRRARENGESRAQGSVSIKDLSLTRLGQFLKIKEPLTGNLDHLWVRVRGNPAKPSGWEGSGLFRLSNAQFDEFKVDQAKFDLYITKGISRITEGLIATGENRITLKGERNLPTTADELFTHGLDTEITLSAPQLSAFHPALQKGAVQGEGNLFIKRNFIALKLASTFTDLSWEAENASVQAAEGKNAGLAEWDFSERNHDSPWFTGLTGEATFSAQRITANGAEIDQLLSNATFVDGKVEIPALRIERGKNHAVFKGDYQLPENPHSPQHSFSVGFKVDAPALSELNAVNKEAEFKGSLSANGAYRLHEGKFSGSASLEAHTLKFKAFTADLLKLTVPVENESVKLREFELDLGASDRLQGEGEVQLRAPFPYRGKLAGSISDLQRLAPLVHRPLAGSLHIAWEGTGEISTLRHSGGGYLKIHKGQIDQITGIETNITGEYSPEVISLNSFWFTSDQGSLWGDVSLKDQRMSGRNFRFEWKGWGALDGAFSFPLDLRTPSDPATLFPKGAPIEAKIALEKLNLHHLSTVHPKRGAPLIPFPFEGELSAFFDASGTLEKPHFQLKANGVNLYSPNAAGGKLKPSKAGATVVFAEDRLSLSAKIEVPQVNPLQVEGYIPLSLERVIQERKIDPATPLHFQVKLPSSPANIVSQIIPQFRFVEGTVNVDAKVEGTLEKPALGGGAALDFKAIRLNDANIPGIDDFKGDLQFKGNEILLKRFNGTIAGGPFGVSGRVVLRDWSDPLLDLRAASHKTLLVRNDFLIVRADTDVTLFGPLSAALVRGTVGINKSLFYRDIDLLPIGLPGKRPPQRIESTPTLSISEKPISDWKFDVEIKTTEPFVVRSNYANGTLTAHLKLGGTGLSPTLDGSAHTEHFTASLPFSRLTVELGALYFSPGEMLNPTLDFHGTSRIRNHTIHVYIYGEADDPQTLFTSEPPLPQEEIIALLATGATTSEFSQNNQALAGRATMLLLQDLYHKLFKRRTPPTAAEEENRPIADRFSFDIGTVDPRSGRQQVGGRFQLSDQFEVGAGFDAEGDVRLQLRYLLRFQ